jgi:hypothetical protein
MNAFWYQAASADKELPRSQRKCREDADMDRAVRLSDGGHRQETAPAQGGEALHNSTDLERLTVRQEFKESPHVLGINISHFEMLRLCRL